MLKVALVQMEVHPGEIQKNAQKILSYIAEYKHQVDVFVLPELCLTGYLLGDLWEFSDFLKESQHWQQKIIESSLETNIVFGNVQVDWNEFGEDGRPRKYNGAIFAHNGVALSNPQTGLDYTIKMLHPNYREFDDERHFYSLQKWCLDKKVSLQKALSPFQIKIGHQNFSLGVSLCEDAWNRYYTQNPFQILEGYSIDLIVNLSCSPFTLNKNKKRNEIFREHSKNLKVPIAYCNCVGIQNNGKNVFTFDGGSTVYFPHRNESQCLDFYQEGVSICDINSKNKVHASNDGNQINDIQQVFKTIHYGASHFLTQLNLNKIVIGISGGIDSAVCAAIYNRILSSENILLVSMPGPYTSKLTRSLARDLAHNLQCYFVEISIEEGIDLTQKQLQNLKIESTNGLLQKTLNLSSFHLENVQARDRSSRILSALSSAFGGVFTCNSNKVEMTVGYSTLYGDLGGFLALIGDLWKNQVYELARHLNSDVYQFQVIPQGILEIVPSAELNDQQNVEKGQGDPLIYEYHDCLFKSWIQGRNRLTPSDILFYYKQQCLQEKLNCSVNPQSLFLNTSEFIQDLEKWWNQYQGIGVSKRVQSPPILSLSSRSLGYDHRESILKPFYSTQYQNLKKELLR